MRAQGSSVGRLAAGIAAASIRGRSARKGAITCRAASMKSFEDVRSHLAARHPLRASEPYFLSFDVELEDGRRQGVYLAELETEGGRKVLRVSSPIASFK